MTLDPPYRGQVLLHLQFPIRMFVAQAYSHLESNAGVHGGHGGRRGPPNGTAVPGVVRRGGRREGATLIWIEAGGHETLPDHGRGGRGRRG